jgi:hypothetical protein
MWIHFLSHKFARLLLPYALALADPWVPRRLALQRLSSMARLFVTLMVAALCAASILFSHSKDFWGSPTTSA